MSFHFTSHLDRQRAVRISLGNSISLRKDAWLNVATEDPTGEPVIVLDDNCHIGYGSIISAKNRIHLERDVHRRSAGPNCGPQSRVRRHHGTDCQSGYHGGWKNPNWSRILDRPRVGHHMPKRRATIGRGCVIAVNSVVTRSIPDYSVVFGSPATIIRQYDPQKGAWRIGPNKNRTTRVLEALSVPIGE